MLKGWQSIYVYFKKIFYYGIYLQIVYLLRYEVYHPQALLSDKELAVNWTQSDLLSCDIISLIINIDQDVLAR